MYPIRFEPIYKDYIWGGDRILTKYQRTEKAPERAAESWEISDREEGMSKVANGPHKGKTLHALMKEMGEELMGKERKFEKFPLLLKIIDAKENLSIQVHPNELSAEFLKGEPKTEMWVALEPSVVFAGLKKGIGEPQMTEAMRMKKVEELLEKLELLPGEAAFIPGGRVHAICAGSLLYEIQQNSNTTYRLYDWGRLGADGKARPLHIKEGMEAISWGDRKEAKAEPRRLESDLHHQLIALVSCPFFVVLKADVFDKWSVSRTPRSFQVFFCMGGSGKLTVDGNMEPLEPGMTYLIPAASSAIQIEGRCQVLWIRLP